ncbi:4-hydroxybenzoate octaprenyltransferase [BD1-7 clade bacterium]|uniref:4-hydroxybenzoate octaprenyltransferase n=1 Tax=BD1-7 clade bacterium TaxID=2029982 RepID=A0A5S9MZH0_9GAMM|nr:4-hydroxybenzoate octaprenyltransferase [BD1-7 clade bacterium]CAA0082948.1 4-hydroxybenzoate octaprenyltransferase [BD1-7 clade bacterium]
MILQKAHIHHYLDLMRFDRPIGTYLLLWPTLWSLWLAADGIPSIPNLVIFTIGVFLMRSAGCVINDYADRNIDGHVERTQHRPLAAGLVSTDEALMLCVALVSAAFVLVLFTNWLTVGLSFGGVLLAGCYPFMKRYTYFPQVFLGAAFSWAVIMAFAAETGDVPKEAWIIYVAVTVWTVVYDTFYAMVDRDDDLKIGVKSTAILFGDFDRLITAVLQLFVVFALLLIGYRFHMGIVYYLSTIIAACLFAYQQFLIIDYDHDKCFKAFLNNNWVGAVLFVGIAVDYAVR